MDQGNIWSVLVLLLIWNAIVSASDTAIATFGPLRARQLKESKPNLSNHSIKFWLEKPDRVQTTIVLSNTLIITLVTALVIVLLGAARSGGALVYASVVATILVMFFGKIVPKSFARARYEVLVLPALRFVYFSYLAMLPLVMAFSFFVDRATRFFGGKTDQGYALTEEELEYLVTEGEKAGVLEETKKQLIVSVFDFGETKVREIMTPRPDIIGVAVDCSFHDAMQIAIESGHSRLPIYSEKIDNIVGILLAKDLLKVASATKGIAEPSLSKLMRQPFYVPETKLIMDVFKDLKRTKNHIAVVIDEYGGTAGIVTMEDILEEIVGEIQDEHDTDDAKIIEIENGIYDVLGSVNLSEFFDFFKVEQDQLGDDEAEQGADTISGYMTQLLGDLPEVGQTVRIGPLNVEIVEVKRHRIHMVRVSRILSSGES